MKITPSQELPFQEKEFTLSLTGKELLRIWYLSYNYEGGPKYPDSNSTKRLWVLIKNELSMSSDQLEDLAETTDFTS
jgi:hypothetical protein